VIETGLYAITNCGVPRHYAVDVKAGYAGLAVFVPGTESTNAGMAGVMPWADLRVYLETPPDFGNAAGFVDTHHDEVFVPDLPGTTHGGIYKGRSYIFAAGMNGLDELVDFSLLDLAVGINAQPLPWRNRFAQTAREKIDTSFRHRARERLSNAMVVFMPIAAPFDQTRIEVLCECDPILLNGTTLAGRIPDADIPKDGIWFKQFYFHAVADGLEDEALRVPAGGRSEVPVRLRWNKDGAPCAHAMTLKLECDAGYLPIRRLMTDQTGQGSFAVEALGLAAGERITVKINTEHYTAIGKITLEVV
jgi:hypothetical protein